MADINLAITSDGDDPPDLKGLENGSLELVTVEEEGEDNKVQDDVESGVIKSEVIVKGVDEEEDDEDKEDDEDAEYEENCFVKLIPNCLKSRIPWLIMLGTVGFGFWVNTFGVFVDVGSDYMKGAEFITGYYLIWQEQDFVKGFVFHCSFRLSFSDFQDLLVHYEASVVNFLCFEFLLTFLLLFFVNDAFQLLFKLSYFLHYQTFYVSQGGTNQMGGFDHGFYNGTTNLGTPDTPYLEIQVHQLSLPLAWYSSL